MKTIGYTDTGNVLVECTQFILRAFNLLADTAKGKPFSAVYSDYMDRRIDADLAPAFRAITEWLQVKDRANALRELAQNIDAAIKANGGAK